MDDYVIAGGLPEDSWVVINTTTSPWSIVSVCQTETKANAVVLALNG
jgi:hypothetical protein